MRALALYHLVMSVGLSCAWTYPDCEPDNCYRELTNSRFYAEAKAFCPRYLAGSNISIPYDFSNCVYSTALSSACSCITYAITHTNPAPSASSYEATTMKSTTPFKLLTATSETDKHEKPHSTTPVVYATTGIIFATSTICKNTTTCVATSRVGFVLTTSTANASLSTGTTSGPLHLANNVTTATSSVRKSTVTAGVAYKSVEVVAAAAGLFVAALF